MSELLANIEKHIEIMIEKEAALKIKIGKLVAEHDAICEERAEIEKITERSTDNDDGDD